MEENRLTEEELAAKAAELEEREREIELKEKKLNTIDEKVVGMKESIYSHINVSVKTMDKVIIVLSVILVAAIVLGLVTR
jgi:hypothetical protein